MRGRACASRRAGLRGARTRRAGGGPSPRRCGLRPSTSVTAARERARCLGGRVRCRGAPCALSRVLGEERPERRPAVTVDRDTPALDALRAADIRPERTGAARTRRLSPAQREFYVWILREFASSRSPSGEATRAAATRIEIDLAEALAVLAREDLVHVDANGR